MHSSLEPECNGVPHGFAQIACARRSILDTPPSGVAAQQVLLISPVLGVVAAHLEDVDVLVHELGLVALGYAFNLFAESVAWSRIDRSEIVIILITTHLLVLG